MRELKFFPTDRYLLYKKDRSKYNWSNELPKFSWKNGGEERRSDREAHADWLLSPRGTEIAVWVRLKMTYSGAILGVLRRYVRRRLDMVQRS